VFTWSVHPSIPVGIGLLLALYGLTAGPLRRRHGWGPPVEPEQATAFVSACGILFIALTGPIHDLADSYLFSIHMIQHLILTLVVAPLLLVGTPDWLARVLLRPRWLRAAAETLGSAPAAFLIFNGTLLIWHVPAFYSSTLIDIDIHISEHLLFLAAALVGWWPILAPAPEFRSPVIVQLIYMLLVTFPMKLLGLLLLLAGTVLYPVYAIAPRVWGLDPHLDQQLGGVIMLVPATFVFFIALGAHFFRWYAESQHQSRGESNVVPLARERVL
jgi:putative membrane protein